MGELQALAKRCDTAMLLATRHHFNLGGTARAAALQEAVNYAALAAALRALAAPKARTEQPQ